MNHFEPMIRVRGLSKTFTLHNQGGAQLPVLEDVEFDAGAGDCLILAGASGAGKSTLLRCLYGNYLASGGSIRVRKGQHGTVQQYATSNNSPERLPSASPSTHTKDDWLELVGAPEQDVLWARRHAIGYVSQFLRVIPRVDALDVVAEPLRQAGIDRDTARGRAAALLQKLRLPERLWSVPPATFSGGEQQRVNIARGFIADHPILLLDEPTASLDGDNRAVVVELLLEARSSGRCLIGIFHDASVGEAVGTRTLPMRALGETPDAATAEHVVPSRTIAFRG
ncbi:phosphonate C-P lyase system protein PhnL [Robbsia andropogonis]|uniref:phosphonate C-P lyase system protein PhnL n=1 Tax=Robbsia andropogonis TaxID=28092 RepID=UPI00209CB9B3|nr:ATP-binding cassette domain-containing protein [Robbsia andropogonis]MCP1118097.1 ATP-binding cassette domain-containing protein [Robbsia andropogonis]MCP1127622.1 ATP-binding cassette domain-containing protein [Robbsia andropogonis]